MALPPVGLPVLCLLQHATTKGIQEHELLRVENGGGGEDDWEWRTADDRSGLAYDWSVIGWRISQQAWTECVERLPDAAELPPSGRLLIWDPESGLQVGIFVRGTFFAAGHVERPTCWALAPVEPKT